MKRYVIMPEHIELSIFDRLEAGDSTSQIAKDFGCSTWTVRNLRSMGRPRWRHKAHGNLEPSPAVIAWHCEKLQKKWTAKEELQRRVEKPIEYEVLRASLADLGLSALDLEWTLCDGSF